MTTLGEFHQLVVQEAHKGDRVDSLVPPAARRAARWLERNYTFSYMERFVSFSLNPEADSPRTAPFFCHAKAIEFVRGYDAECEEYWAIKPVHPRDVADIGLGAPKRYWKDGHQYLWFDNVPDQVYSLEASYVSYTEWPEDEETDDIWLVNNAEDVLLAQTMIQLAPGQREPEWIALYGKMRDEGLNTLIRADSALRWQSTEARMRYMPEGVYDPRL